MKNVRIEVLKATCTEDLALEYGKKGINTCSLYKPGDVFFSDGTKPEKFCGDAWTCLEQYVTALAKGDINFYNGEWVNRENLAIVSCNDGLTPVIFKVERVSA